METQENLETLEVGTKESIKLDPAIVKIVKSCVETVGDKGSKKAVFEVKHPAQEELIKISAVKIERKGKLERGGLWFNQDEDGKIRKGSFLANFIGYLKAKNIKELEGKECATVEDESGYLVFKAY
jgi:hypothetical protein